VIRGEADRQADVVRLLEASREVYARRAELAPDIVASSGLSPQGVLLGFESLERAASAADLRALVAAAGDAPCVHVILSANVFVAPLRALAVARAAASNVTVRPSRRDPWLARALVAAAADPALVLAERADVSAIARGEIHVYGRRETIAAVRSMARPGVRVRGHGPGIGIAVVTRAGNLASCAAELARDVAVFDQRGCLSPRAVAVEGGIDRARALAEALHAAFEALQALVPLGEVAPAERAQAASWRDAMAFAGGVWSSEHHAVGLAARGGLWAIPPPGRNVSVIPLDSLSGLRAELGPFASEVTAIGSDAPAQVGPFAPSHVRLSTLGEMQRPPLDGPVDRRKNE
jgi:hypothetical protein